ncbi:hypothetical protein JSR06_00550 [Candidatus Vidania fulgoroideae]|uniref:3-phosphoshikimate 1-carboxyvinyltransferase n=1 Tax=Candidatus Vidania fulgoroideorum TaxID=881286 RepID=A0A974XAD4_9PROT|nr:hypothetical protein JSR06_00550 [Candidatus Vidania fulgoroideae]
MNQLINFGEFRYKSRFLPVSKSLFNRLLFILSFINRTTVLNIPSLNIDTKIMIYSLIGIGKDILFRNNTITIVGNNYVELKYSYFNFRNSGITARIISLLVLFRNNRHVILDGSSEMRRRPLLSLLKIYSSFCINRKFQYLDKHGYFPIKVLGKPKLLLKNNISVSSNISSQFLTSLILNIPLFYKRGINIFIGKLASLSYIYMTVKLMHNLGIDISIRDNVIYYNRSDYKYNSNIHRFIEIDYSSFSYIVFSYFANEKILSLKSINFNSIQSEVKFIKVFNAIGYKVIGKHRSLMFNKNTLCFRYVCIDCSLIIDTSMIIPILAFRGLKKVKLYNIYNWNYKESRRLDVLIKELKKLGCFVKHGKNWIKVVTLVDIRSVVIGTYHDHRIFMIFFPLIFYSGIIAISNPNNIKKTYPMFLRNECYKN